jgi:hypothetical protein
MSTKQLSKICTDCKQEFIIDEGDLTLYEKVGLKVPHQCFQCRSRHSMSFAIFGKFRKGVSDLSDESFITVSPLHPRHPIYTAHEWYSDAWDATSFGQVYDSSRSFFEQFKELQEKIPRPHQEGKNNVNCDWCSDVWDSKHSSLSRHIVKCENVHCSYRVVESKDCRDAVVSFNIEDCYDCLFCFNSFNLNYSENSRDCIDSSFLFDCRNCQNCFMSWDLRNKQYYIRNKEYTKETYEAEIKKINLGSWSTIQELKKEFNDIVKKEAIHRENFNIKTTNSVGNYLNGCDNCINVFTWSDSQNCRNCIRGLYSKDCIDQTITWNVENSGNNGSVDGGYQIKHSMYSNARYSEYLDLCEDVEYCFGCIGLRKKKYCILNRQYTKEAYETLRTQIISDMERRGEYGEFFPANLAICEQNFSENVIYFPDMDKEKVTKNGGYWSDEDLSSTDGISSLELPDNIAGTPEAISAQALICPKTHYRFNISSGEYEFHKRKNFALPRYHFDFRVIESAKKTAVTTAYPYKCFYCKKDIMAYYPPEWGYQKIACEDCYKQNIA